MGDGAVGGGVRRVLLSPAQVSAIECRTHGAEQVDGLVLDGRHLLVPDPAAVARALSDAANAEGDAAHYGHAGNDAPFARRAARSLEAAANKVLRLSSAGHNEVSRHATRIEGE